MGHCKQRPNGTVYALHEPRILVDADGNPNIQFVLGDKLIQKIAIGYNRHFGVIRGQGILQGSSHNTGHNLRKIKCDLPATRLESAITLDEVGGHEDTHHLAGVTIKKPGGVKNADDIRLGSLVIRLHVDVIVTIDSCIRSPPRQESWSLCKPLTKFNGSLSFLHKFMSGKGERSCVKGRNPFVLVYANGCIVVVEVYRHCDVHNGVDSLGFNTPRLRWRRWWGGRRWLLCNGSPQGHCVTYHQGPDLGVLLKARGITIDMYGEGAAVDYVRTGIAMGVPRSGGC